MRMADHRRVSRILRARIEHSLQSSRLAFEKE